MKSKGLYYFMFLVFIAGTVVAQDKDIPAQIDQHTFDPSTLIWLKATAVNPTMSLRGTKQSRRRALALMHGDEIATSLPA